MALKTVTFKVTAPDGSAISGAEVRADLSQACVIAGTQEIVPSSVKTTTAVDGTASLVLQANNDMTPTGTSYMVTESGSTGTYRYTVVVPITGKAITNAINNGSGLIRITATAHGFVTGNKVDVGNVTGTTEANKTGWTVTVIDANTFDLQASVFANAYVSGGVASLPFAASSIQSNAPTASPTPARVSTLTVDGAATFTAGPVVIGADPGGAQLLRVGGTGHFSGLLTLDAGLTVSAGPVSLPASTFSGTITISAGGLAVNAGGIQAIHGAQATTPGGGGNPPALYGLKITGTGALPDAYLYAVTDANGGLAIQADRTYFVGYSVNYSKLTTIEGFPVIQAGGTAQGFNGVTDFLVQTNGSNITLFHGSNASDTNIAAYTGFKTNLLGSGVGGTAKISVDSTGLSFYAGATVAKQTVNGSRAGNAALASLLTALAATGLLTDSSTA